MKSPPLGCGLKTSSPVSLFFELPWSLLPRLLYSPWASSFQAWGLGKGSHRGFSVGAREDPQCPGWVTLVPPPTPQPRQTVPAGLGVRIRRPSLVFGGPSPALPHLSFPSQAPDPQHFKASGPRCVLQKLFPFQRQAGRLLFQMSGKAQ